MMQTESHTPAMTSKKGYFSTYQSPNIVIDPNKSLIHPPLVKKIKVESNTTNTNLRILHEDKQLPEIQKEMDACQIKNKNNLNKPIKNETCINKVASSNVLSKSNILWMDGNICSKTKVKENCKKNNKNCAQTEDLVPELTSGLGINNHSSRAKNIDLNCKKQLFQDHQFNSDVKRDCSSANHTSQYANLNDERNNHLTLPAVKTELNNAFYSNKDIPKKDDKDNKQFKNNYKILQNIKDKNEKNSARKIVNNIIENNVKETREKTKTKKSKEATEKYKAQVNKKYAAKVAKHSKNKTKQPKKIKITINITYNNLHNKKNVKSSNTNVDGDLSFLDDFDVDEVVESLFNGKEHSNLEHNIDAHENIIGNSKIRNIQNTELTYVNHRDSCLKQTSSYENKIEPHKIQSNVDDKKLPLDKIIANNSRNNPDGQIDCNNIPKTLDGKFETNRISTQYKNEDSKQIKKDIRSEENKFVDHNMNQSNKKQNIGQGVLLNKFVTKSDKDLARNLEIKMYDTLKQKYSVVAVTHYGKFSKIFKCIDMPGNYYAVKILDNPDSNHFKKKNKENILNKLKKDIPEENLSFIHLLHNFQIDNHMCYMTNYYSNNLEQLLNEKRLHIHEIHHLAKQLVEAVTVLRNNNIVHHDIKPSHILVDGKADKLKLCGFDEALYYIYSDNLKANIGTINYASPEKILGYSHGFSIDVWSTALVIYEMATNSMLFTGATDNEILFKQMTFFGNVPESVIQESRFKSAHFHGTTFIKRGLNLEPDIRINNIVKCNNIHYSIFAAQSSEDQIGCVKKNAKLETLVRLLEKMLLMDPRKRLTIEYVYADNFFFSNFNTE